MSQILRRNHLNSSCYLNSNFCKDPVVPDLVHCFVCCCPPEHCHCACCCVAVDAAAAAVENYKEMRSRDIFDSAVGRLGGEADEDDGA